MEKLHYLAMTEMQSKACEINNELLKRNDAIPCIENAIILKPQISSSKYLEFVDYGKILFTFNRQWKSESDFKLVDSSFVLQMLMDPSTEKMMTQSTENIHNAEYILPFCEQVAELYFSHEIAEYIHICNDFSDEDYLYRVQSIFDTQFYKRYLEDVTRLYIMSEKYVLHSQN